MKKYAVELLGTFFLVFTVRNTVIGKGAGDLAPIAIGLALMVMVMVFAGAASLAQPLILRLPWV